jgi:hypothetical protein
MLGAHYPSLTVISGPPEGAARFLFAPFGAALVKATDHRTVIQLSQIS